MITPEALSALRDRLSAATASHGGTEAEVVNAWNRRAPSSELLALRAAVSEARAAFKVEYAEDGRVQSVSYGSEALRPLIAMLDRARALQSHSTGDDK